MSRQSEIKIALVGKYVALPDAYLSVVEALNHAGIARGARVKVLWIDAETVTEENAAELLKDAAGVVVPGGFGSRGLSGKRAAIRWARENKVPFLGLCLGMQMACIEFARNVMGLENADTTEVEPGTPYPVIDLMPDQNLKNLGHTMRLGAYPCALKEGTIARQAYGTDLISERHRHRYEFNNAFLDAFEKAGMVGIWLKSSSCPAIPSLWPRSSIPNLKAAPIGRIPCSSRFWPKRLRFAIRKSNRVRAANGPYP